jgi:hypothetical protein
MDSFHPMLSHSLYSEYNKSGMKEKFKIHSFLTDIEATQNHLKFKSYLLYTSFQAFPKMQREKESCNIKVGLQLYTGFKLDAESNHFRQ